MRKLAVLLFVGLLSTPAAAVVDTTPPIVTGLTVSAVEGSPNKFQAVVTATDETNLQYILLYVEKKSYPVCVVAGTSATCGPIQFSFGGGTHTVSAYARDAAGNLSDAVSVEVTR